MATSICAAKLYAQVSDDPHTVDYQQLRSLHQETSWARDRTLFDLQRAIAASDLVLTAWIGSTLVGCVRVLSDFVYRAILCDVIVHPNYRRQGIGTLLVEHATSHPRLARVQKFTLLTETAGPFYQRLGWKEYPGVGMVLERDTSRN